MLTLNDGRNELWQWDTGRKLEVDVDCSQVHFSNKVFGRSIDVDVVDGVATIPDILLQTDKELNVWAFVGTAENGYTKISKIFKVNRRNKPADYVFTPTEQTSLEEIKEKIEYLESIQNPDAIKNAVEDYLEQNPVDAPVQSVNGKTGKVSLTALDVGAISQDDLQEATNKALEQAKKDGLFDGPKGDPGDDYVLTEADKDEIAKKAAALVEVPDSGGNVDLTGVVKSVNGVTPDENGNVEIMVSSGTAAAIDYDQNVHSVNHRGYRASAPENTIPAYILSKQMGFTYVEADVSFTSDGVAVLLHDSTIDRTSNGSGNISAMTYAEASKYDYGSWKNTKYTGTRIPTFEEFIILCKRIGLHPYIELKQNGTYTQAQIQALVEMVKNCGMDGKVTWISFSADYLRYVKTADSSARLGYLISSVTSAVIATAQGLQTDTNEVFIDSSDYDADAISLCRTAGLPLEIWTINSTSTIQNMNAYITGVTSDNLIAGKILYDAGMVYEYGIDGDEPVVPDEPEKTLTSISATYSGGEVAVGTAVSALTGIVVTAHYSDGSSESVTGYTLSGTIAEGSNTITVTYEGKTATFIVIGKASEYTPIFEFSLVQGRIDTQASTGYLYPSGTRVSYVGTDCALTPGKRYRLLGVNGVKYGVQTITETGYAKIQSGSDLVSGDKRDSGWKESGYEFVADSMAVCAWLTASFTSGNITPEQAMPVYLEELDDGNVGDDTRTLLYNWDFTKSMTDTVAGAVATTSGTQDGNGVSFTDSNKYILLLDNESILDKMVEIDISSGMLEQPSSQHARLFSVAKTVNTSAGYTDANAFLWRHNNYPGWTVYNNWGTSLDEAQYPIGFFDEKTIRLVFDSSGNVTLRYAEIGTHEFVTVNTFDKSFGVTSGKFVIGSDRSNDLFPITIRGVRIYEGEST